MSKKDLFLLRIFILIQLINTKTGNELSVTVLVKFSEIKKMPKRKNGK